MIKFDHLESHDRRVIIEFRCRRCGTTSYRSAEECISEVDYNNLWDLRPPADWENGGFYYPIFCPACAEAYQKFMNMEA